MSAIAPSDKVPGHYALFSNNRLYLAEVKTQFATEIAVLPNIQRICIGTGDGRRGGKEQIISLYFHHPYICATERFGVNSALIHAENGSLIYEYKNYLDYFHSQLTVSSDGKHFLSNGWVWQPYDMIYLFNTKEFLKSYELCRVYADLGLGSGYNWDRPCALIDNGTFVVALDDTQNDGELDEEDSQNYEYHQLAFFRTDAEIYSNKYEHRWIEPYRRIKYTAFTPDKDGEVTGKLYYDKISARITAITQDKSAFVISMDGDIIENMPDIIAAQTGVFKSNASEIGWDYSPTHSVFYTWQDEIGIVERQWSLLS